MARRPKRNPPFGLLLANPGAGKVLSGEVHSLAYKHADDGKNYRHDFEGPVRATLRRDGSVMLRHAKGRELWRDFPERPYLVNPQEARRTMKKKTRAATRRKTKRPPPKGYRSWKAYMAELRRSKGFARAMATKPPQPAGGTMARKAKGRKRGRKGRRSTGTAVTHRNAPVMKARRRHRRNPPGVKGLMGFGLNVAMDTGVLVGVRAGQRVWPQLVKLDTASAMGRGAQALAAVFAGGALAYFGYDQLGCKIATAGLSVPAEALLHDWTKDNANPIVASAFGDDSVLISAYPGAGVGAYPGTAVGSGAERNGMGSYPGARGMQIQQ